tara:strand:- start:5576 stop:5833 length:258 start_codon:yes stop_codon:yes gene_type:complete
MLSRISFVILFIFYITYLVVSIRQSFYKQNDRIDTVALHLHLAFIMINVSLIIPLIVYLNMPDLDIDSIKNKVFEQVPILKNLKL